MPVSIDDFGDGLERAGRLFKDGKLAESIGALHELGLRQPALEALQPVHDLLRGDHERARKLAQAQLNDMIAQSNNPDLGAQDWNPSGTFSPVEPPRLDASPKEVADVLRRIIGYAAEQEFLAARADNAPSRGPWRGPNSNITARHMLDAGVGTSDSDLAGAMLAHLVVANANPRSPLSPMHQRAIAETFGLAVSAGNDDLVDNLARQIEGTSAVGDRRLLLLHVYGTATRAVAEKKATGEPLNFASPALAQLLEKESAPGIGRGTKRVTSPDLALVALEIWDAVAAKDPGSRQTQKRLGDLYAALRNDGVPVDPPLHLTTPATRGWSL